METIETQSVRLLMKVFSSPERSWNQNLPCFATKCIAGQTVLGCLFERRARHSKTLVVDLSQPLVKIDPETWTRSEVPHASAPKFLRLTSTG